MKRIFLLAAAIMFLQLSNSTSSHAQTTIACPGNKIVPTDAGSCMATVLNVDPVVSPAGAEVYHKITTPSGTIFGTGSVSGLSLPLGVNTIMYYSPFVTGVECEFTITVEDREPPVMVCPPNVTVKCPADVPVPVTFGVFDPCAQPGTLNAEFVRDVRSNEICPGRFTITRTYRATDAAGNTSTCTQIITVNDDVAPRFFQPPPISPINVSCPSNVPAVIPDEYTAYDECTGEEVSVQFRQIKTNGSCDNKYTLTRTWTATDLCGNSAVYTVIINVNDTEAPQFVILPGQSETIKCASAIPAAAEVTAKDNCEGITTVSLTEVISDQLCANKFKLTRVWTATDACGNTSTTMQIITVNDNEAPVFNGNPPESPILVSCEKSIPAASTQTASDNCAGTPTITYSETKTNVQCVNRFTLTRKWIATDACGNTSSRIQTINVYDNEAPTVTGISANPVVLWPPNHKMRDVTINYTATDNCETTSTLSVSSSDPVNGGSDGDQAPDWQVIDDHHVKLRAEKANNGQARYYTININISDGCNAPVDTSITVVVAHNITSPQTGHPFKVGSTVPFNGVFWDKPGNKHSAKWLLDGNTAANGTVVEPSGNQNGKVAGSYKFNSPGIYKLQMNVTDQHGVTSYANTNNDLDAIVVIYDPNGGNTYGGGYFNSPAGALKANPSATGKASYGFAMNYFKNSTNPKGETQFEFKVGEFEFNALNFDYLVISNSMAQFKGTGKIIGGQSGVGFTMTVTDGQLDGSGIDKIRMKIYNKNNGSIIYDNQPGASDAVLPTQAVGTNSTIVISGTNSSLTKTNETQMAEMEINSAEISTGLDAIAFPNPSAGNFTINVKGNSKTGKITMQVMDMYGRIIETRNVNANSPTRFGDRYNPGTYFVRILQGKEHKEIKLIKLSD